MEDNFQIVIVLNLPGTDKQTIDLNSIKESKQNIKSIHAISSNAKVKWKWVNGHLQIHAPIKNLQYEAVNAVAFKIRLM